MQRHMEFVPKNRNTFIPKKGLITGIGGRRHGTGLRIESFQVDGRFTLICNKERPPQWSFVLSSSFMHNFF
jgi:hypothetical protein